MDTEVGELKKDYEKMQEELHDLVERIGKTKKEDKREKLRKSIEKLEERMKVVGDVLKKEEGSTSVGQKQSSEEVFKSEDGKKVFRIAVSSQQAVYILRNMDTIDKIRIKDKVKNLGKYRFKVNDNHMVELYDDSK